MFSFVYCSDKFLSRSYRIIRRKGYIWILEGGDLGLHLLLQRLVLRELVLPGVE